jgi:hypothetical protein
VQKEDCVTHGPDSSARQQMSSGQTLGNIHWRGRH